MREKVLVAGAKVIEPVFAVRRSQNAVLRAPAIAHSKHLAGFAVAGQTIELGLPERPLARAFQQIGQRGFHYIPRAVARVCKVVTAKEVAVCLDHGDIAAGLPEDA